jgi:hypothetical protein
MKRGGSRKIGNRFLKQKEARPDKGAGFLLFKPFDKLDDEIYQNPPED